MKKSLGRSILLFFLFLSYTQAQELASYKLSANKTTAYTKEAITLTFETKQEDYTDNMMFTLEPKKSSDYKIILLNKTVDDKKKHHASAKFTYLLFGLKAKKIAVDFDFIVRTASDQAVANSFVDDHDDSIATQTHDTTLSIKPLQITIKPLKHPVDFVGDFTLKAHIPQTKINQYESANIIYTLQGKGYYAQTFQPIHEIKNVTIFSEVNDLFKKNTQEGYAIKREYIYALSAKKDFTIAAVNLLAYSPTKNSYYTLATPQYNIKVEAIDTSKLLDNEEYPNETPLIHLESLKQYFIYLMLFFSGYLTAKLQTPRLRKNKHSKEYNAIEKTENPKALLFTLINLHKEQLLKQEMQDLEEILYQNAEHDFHAIKKKILKKVS